MSPLSHDRIPLILGTPSHGCLLLNELLLSTVKWSCKNLKALVASAVALAGFFQQFAAFDGVWNTCCSPNTGEASLEPEML